MSAIWEDGRTFSGYQSLIYWSYSTLQDYLWKSPNFIQSEVEVERGKLAAYFPSDDPQSEELRNLRIELEGAKLFKHFPLLIAESNLYLATAWFEKHLHRLAKFYDEASGADLRGTSGNGANRYFQHLKAAKIGIHELESYERVQFALVIRNALLHASGMLELSRDEKRIRDGVKAELFLEKVRRKKEGGNADEQGRPEVWVENGQLGVNFYYAQRVSRDMFALLIETSDRLPSSLTWQPVSSQNS